MELSKLSEKELLTLRDQIDELLDKMETTVFVNRLKKTQIFAKYVYYIYTDEGCDEPFLAFGSEKPGYVDDHVPDMLREDYNDLTNFLGLSECMSCTYEFDQDKQAHIENILQEIGMQEGEPAWI